MKKAVRDLLKLYSPQVRALDLAARALVLDVMPEAIEQVDPADTCTTPAPHLHHTCTTVRCVPSGACKLLAYTCTTPPTLRVPGLGRQVRVATEPR